MNCLIIEDELFAARKLMQMIHRYDVDCKVLEVLESIEDAVIWFHNNDSPDLIFLDIHLSDGTSFEIFDQVDIEVPIIITTAFDRYAIQAYKTNSIDYLLKPVRYEELKLAMDKYQKWFGDQKSITTINWRALEKIILQRKKPYKARFLVKAGNLIKTVPISDISYFTFADRTTQIVTHQGRHYPIGHNLDELEGLLDPNDFYRVNRQFIVTINSITKIHPWFKGRLKLQLEPPQMGELVVSADKTPPFKQWLDR